MTYTAKASQVQPLSACPLCGKTSWKKLPVPGHWIGSEVFQDLQGQLGLVECADCGLVFTNPRPSMDKLSAFYSGDTYTCHEFTGSTSADIKADFVLDRLSKYLPPDAPKSVLDYGAGGGDFLSRAREHGWKTQGFEPGRRGLESCLKAGLSVTDNLDELPKSEFGLITLHHVFEHLADPTEVLDGIRKYIAPKGRLFIEVPNARSLRAQLAAPFLSQKFHVDERYRAFPIHLMYYSKRTLSLMLNKAGWEVEKTLTLGMGLDEFLTQAESPHGKPAASSPKTVVASSSSPASSKSWKHKLRDAFLDKGLGENLAVIAYPKN